MEGTRRLYHEDPTLRRFEARVIECRPGPAATTDVVLDRTAFFPTGGGQPHDGGTLAGRRVLDVTEEDGRVVHRIEGGAIQDVVEGEIDWDRRLDHCRQHTGQHILSRAFLREAEAQTVGFHLGEQRCTVDLDRGDLDEETLERAERTANEAVMADLPVRVSVYPDAAALPEGLRRQATVERDIRVVAIGNFDAAPCCGTHCSRSGEVGLIKVLRWERKKGGLRVEFVCGGRALDEVRLRHRALREAALSLTTEELEVPARVDVLRAEGKRLRVRLEKTERELRRRLVEEWGREPSRERYARDLGPGRSDWLTPAATALAGIRNETVLLSSEESDGVHVVVAVPEGGKRHAGNLLQGLLERHGGRGGGSQRLARGRIPVARLQGLVSAWRNQARSDAGEGEEKR